MVMRKKARIMATLLILLISGLIGFFISKKSINESYMKNNKSLNFSRDLLIKNFSDLIVYGSLCGEDKTNSNCLNFYKQIKKTNESQVWLIRSVSQIKCPAVFLEKAYETLKDNRLTLLMIEEFTKNDKTIDFNDENFTQFISINETYLKSLDFDSCKINFDSTNLEE